MNSRIFTKNGKYLMLAIDQRGSFRKMINPENPDSIDPNIAIDIKQNIISAVLDQFSGVLIDFEYGLPAYNQLPNHSRPFLLPAEATGYTDKEGDRLTDISKTALDIKQAGGSGVKLLVYYNPGSSVSSTQLEITKKVLEDAHNQNLPLFLEILNYNSDIKVVETVKEFLNAGIYADVFKLEYPGNALECQKLTNTLGDTPWILLSKGADFNDFTNYLDISIKSGCSGFLAGRALWKEFIGLTDSYSIKDFLENTLPSRFKTISDITLLG